MGENDQKPKKRERGDHILIRSSFSEPAGRIGITLTCLQTIRSLSTSHPFPSLAMKTLSDTDYSRTLAAVLDHLVVEGRITNADVRSLTKLRYDHVVIFFNRAMAEGHIERRGRYSGTNYVVTEGVG